MRTFAHSHIHKTIVASLLVVEARLAVLMGALPLAKVNNFSIFSVSVMSIGQFGFEFLLNELHLEASVRDLILAHGGVFHSDAHQKVPLLHQDFFVQIFFEALAHTA